MIIVMTYLNEQHAGIHDPLTKSRRYHAIMASLAECNKGLLKAVGQVKEKMDHYDYNLFIVVRNWCCKKKKDYKVIPSIQIWKVT